MKTKLSIFLTALVGGLISTMPAQAASFNNSGIYFYEDTDVDFEFLGSYNFWQSTLGVVNWATGEETILIEEVQNADGGGIDNQGTVAGRTVLNPTASYTFAADTEYSLFLRSLTPDGENPFAGTNIENVNTIYSTDMKNPGWFSSDELGGTGKNEDGSFTIGVDQRKGHQNDFDRSLNGRNDLLPNGQRRAIFLGDLLAGDEVRVLFEDTTSNGADNDFDDFVFKATIAEDVPEPATLAGLGLVAGGMFLSRRKKQK